MFSLPPFLPPSSLAHSLARRLSFFLPYLTNTYTIFVTLISPKTHASAHTHTHTHDVCRMLQVSVQNFNAPNDTTLFTKVVLQGQAPQALPGHLPLHPGRQLGYTNTTPAAAPATAMNSSSGTSYYTRESSVREMASPEASAEYETEASGGGGGASVPSAPPPPPPPPQAPSYGACQALYAFPGAQQGEIAVAEGETLDMIEDDGSGWVLAGKRDGSGRQGFVRASPPINIVCYCCCCRRCRCCFHVSSYLGNPLSFQFG